MGLIDVLTQYDTKKKAAHAAKTVKHGVSSTREEGKRWRAAVKVVPNTRSYLRGGRTFDVCSRVMS